MQCPSCERPVDVLDTHCPACLTRVDAPAERRPAAAVVIAPPAQPVPEEVPVPVVPRCGTHPEMPAALTCDRCGRYVCVQCDPEVLTESRRTCPECLAREATGLNGIRGWLILPALHLVLGLFAQGSGLVRAALGLFGYGVSALMTRVETGVVSVLLYEAVASLGMLAFGGYVALRFFSRRQNAPNLMVAFYLLNLVNLVMDGALAGLLLEPEHKVPSSVPDVAKALVAAVVWGWYFQVSKRVKATFTVP